MVYDVLNGLAFDGETLTFGLFCFLVCLIVPHFFLTVRDSPVETSGVSRADCLVDVSYQICDVDHV